VLPAAGGIVFVNEVVVVVNCLYGVGEGAAVGQGVKGMQASGEILFRKTSVFELCLQVEKTKVAIAGQSNAMIAMTMWARDKGMIL